MTTLRIFNLDEARCELCGGSCQPLYDNGQQLLEGPMGKLATYQVDPPSWESDCCNGAVITGSGLTWVPEYDDSID